MKFNVFKWDDFRALSEEDKVKEYLVRVAYAQYLEGNDLDEDEWTTTESMLSYQMFKSGFLVCQSIIDPPILKSLKPKVGRLILEKTVKVEEPDDDVDW